MKLFFFFYRPGGTRVCTEHRVPHHLFHRCIQVGYVYTAAYDAPFDIFSLRPNVDWLILFLPVFFDSFSEGVEQCKEWSSNMTQQIDLAFNIFFMVYFFIRVSRAIFFLAHAETRVVFIWFDFFFFNSLNFLFLWISSSPPAINCGSCWRCTLSSTTSRYLPRSCPSTWTGPGSVRSRLVPQLFSNQQNCGNSFSY